MGDRQGSHRVWPGLALDLLVAVLLCAAAACGESGSGAPGQGSSATARPGGTYDYPLSVDPPRFDPGLNQIEGGATGGYAVLHQVYEGLVRWELQSDGTLKAVPCLAERWKANADCSVWDFQLRRGVMFQAPALHEVTAADVVRDLRYLADPASAAVMKYFVPEEPPDRGTQMSIYLTEIAGTDDEIGVARPAAPRVRARGRYTVRFTLKHPFSEFPETLGGAAFWIWPEDYRQKVGPKAYAEHPVGTGPYVFLQRAYGKSVDLGRNPRWWDTTGGPYIDRIRYRVYPSADAMLHAFRQGLVDWTPVSSEQVAESRTLPQVQSGRWTAQSEPTLSTFGLLINMEDQVVGGKQGSLLRQALTCGCDTQAVFAATAGSGRVLTGLVPPGVPGSQLVDSTTTYDPDRAGALYGQAGSPTLELIFPAREMPGFGEVVRSSYAVSGVSITPNGLMQGPFWDRIDKGMSQLFPMGWVGDYPSIDNFLYPQFHTGAPLNLGSYSNPEVDRLLDEARAMNDAEARLRLYAEAERLILADAPVVSLWVGVDHRLLDDSVANVDFDSMGWVDLWKAWVK